MRVVASKGVAVFVAAMGLVVAGCGDDVSSQDFGTPDLSVADLASNHDLETAPDLQSPLATAQLTLADVGGTFLQPNGSPVPFAHLLIAQQSVAMYASNPQYIDSDFSTAGGAVHGCTSNRYNLASPNGPFPNPDVNAGPIQYSGYSTSLIAADSNGNMNANGMIPAKINCGYDGALHAYGCIYGNPSTDMKTSIEGDVTSNVVFPAPLAAQLGGACLTGMTAHTLPVAGNPVVCEQHPIPSGTTLSETLTGGSGYGALTNQMIPVNPAANGLQDAMTVIKINGAAPANPLDPLFGLTLDGSSDLTITWSCDGTATPGSGCGGATAVFDLAGLLAVASTNPATQFAFTPDFGSSQCAEQLASGTVTLKQAAINKLLQGQTGGSILIALVRLSANPTGTMGHNIFFTGGKGYFGLLTH
jgi:hypothetical protein